MKQGIVLKLFLFTTDYAYSFLLLSLPCRPYFQTVLCSSESEGRERGASGL